MLEISNLPWAIGMCSSNFKFLTQYSLNCTPLGPITTVLLIIHHFLL